jgi:Rrf2 family protein
MKLSNGVEWATHCCTILAALPEGRALPAAKLAEFHGVPAAYLAKHLQSLAAAGIIVSTSGPFGGYRLNRPAAEITLLDVVAAVDGDERLFTCTEVRRRGPAAVDAAHAKRACGIARAMWNAEDAWRAQLRAVTLAALVAEILATVPAENLQKGAEWLQHVEITRRSKA